MTTIKELVSRGLSYSQTVKDKFPCPPDCVELDSLDKYEGVALDRTDGTEIQVSFCNSSPYVELIKKNSIKHVTCTEHAAWYVVKKGNQE